MGSRLRGLAVLAALLVSPGGVQAQTQAFVNADRVNRRIAGRVEAFTKDHKAAGRIDSPILGMPRDLYVYLPPGYHPGRSYPLLLYFHGAFGDEHAFLEGDRIDCLDWMIRQGWIPPMIVACPDGTYSGRNLINSPHSFYINGRGGRFEDHILQEILPFLANRYAIRPEREAHALLGLSAGGLGAMNLALRHREFFSSVATLAAPLNLRYSNLSGDYFENFRPETYRWSTRYDPDEVVAIFASGLIRLRARSFLDPVFGSEGNTIARMARENPADLLFTTDLQPGQLHLYVNYPGRDNLNFDSHAESFAWLARQKGIPLDLETDPEADHSLEYFRENQKRALLWLGQHLIPPAEVPRLRLGGDPNMFVIQEFR